MADFSAATAVEPRTGAGTGADGHEFDAALDEQWSVGGKLHGGYLLAVLGRAAARASGVAHPHLTAIGGAFVEPPAPGPAVVAVEVLRAGRGTTQLRARLSQDGRPCVEALITQGLLEEGEAWWTSSEPVDLPPERDCFPMPPEAPGAGLRVALMEVVEQRLNPADLGFAAGEPGRRGTVSGWQRLADGSDWDPLSLLVALDPVPPVSYDLGLPGWAPTVQFGAYIRRLPAPGPVRVRMTATEVAGDRMDEVAHAWDGKDRLVAQATQFAAVRVPR
ncbi:MULTISPECIES: thioesterase family protein [Thermomonosporaceae]|uniref:thioesterase family protein n=1 Tax=Thermomonosporaceae TaxID=2012 RepID=UPI00255AF8AB|nr:MULTISPECIES: thioesterase family protein [Thermomonosporaceae]MDL4777382.1 thioesterase family protein [Actinomadura xylanilytica]